MKKTIFLFTIILAAALFGTSCLSDDLGGNSNRPVLERGFFLDLSVENSTPYVRSTGVAAEPGESDVNSLHLLFFEANGGRNFIEYYDASPVGEDEYTAPEPLRISDPIKVEFAPTSQLNTSTSYRVLIVANIASYVADVDAWLAKFQGLTYDKALETALNLATEEITAISQNDLLMSAAVHKEANRDVVQATLTRALARFDVNLTAQPNFFSNGNAYTLENASVWNAAVSTGIWSDDYNDYSQHTAKFYDVAVSDETPNQLKGSLYAFENVSTRPYTNDKSTTALILGINNGTVTTYYRVNVTTNNIGQQTLNRNTVYTINVINVLGRGAATPEDAYNSAETLLELSIRDWQMEPTGLFMIDDPYILAIPTNRITFSPDAQTREYRIFTYSPFADTELKMSENLPNGITATLSGDRLTLTVTESTSNKEGYIEFTFGTLSAAIAVRQTGQNVQYLDLSVGITGIPAFPITANAAWAGNVTVTSSGSWTATLYNEEFKFIRHVSGDDENPDMLAIGISGETFSVATAEANGNEEARHGFIIVSLDDNPDVSQVLALTQLGSPKIELIPGHRAVTFASDGTPNPLGSNIFEVHTTSGLDWNVQLYGMGAGHFRIDMDKANNIVTVFAPPSPQEIDLNAEMHVFIAGMPSVVEIVSLKQLPQVLTLNPISVEPIDPTGGITVPITVTSTLPWAIQIMETRGNNFELRPSPDLDPDAPFTGGINGGAFTVKADALPNDNQDRYAEVRIRVSLPGTTLWREIVIEQTSVKRRDILIQNASTARDVMTGTTNQTFISRLRNTFLDNSLFGAPPARIFSGERRIAANVNINPNGGLGAGLIADIFVHNGSVGVTAGAQTTTVINWLNAANPNNNGRDRVLYLSGGTNAANRDGTQRLLRGGGDNTFTVTRSGSPNNLPVRADIQNGTTPAWQKPLLDYLFRTGPFMPDGVTDISRDVRLSSGVGTAAAGGLYVTVTGNNWNTPTSTFIPIIMRGGTGTDANRCVLGIDPVRRIIFVGASFFGESNATARLNWANTNGTQTTTQIANVAFVRNLAAWMIETTQQGDAFTIQFVR
jgi:hypothetical protein